MTTRSRESRSLARHAPRPAAGSPAVASPPARQGHRRRERPGEIAHFASFVRQSEEAYVVRDLDALDALGDGDLVSVPKHYAVAEPFPVATGRKAPGARLLRWSAYALLAAVCGGVGGVLLGALVTLVATVQLQRFALRVRRWRRRRRGPDGSPVLPAAASAQRLRLLTAWVQGMLAIVIGVALLALVVWRLL